MPPVEEVFPGFRQQFADVWRRKGALEQQAATLKMKQQIAIRERGEMPTGAPRSELPMTTQTGIFLSNLMGGQLDPTDAFGEDFRADKEQNEQLLRALGAESAQVNTELLSAKWQYGLMSWLPSQLAGDMPSLEATRRMLAPDYALRPDDVEFFKSLVANFEPIAEEVRAQVGDGPVSPERIAEVVRQLSQPRGSFRKLFSINVNEMTTQELLAGIKESSRFALPPGTSVAETRAAMREAGFSDTEVTQQIDDAAEEAKRLAALINTDMAFTAQVAEDGKSMARGEITSAIDKARLAQALSQPVLRFPYL